MSVTIALGWWLVPFMVTVVAVLVALYVEINGRSSGIGGALVSLLLWAAVIIVSLVAWLLWALISLAVASHGA